MASKKISVGGVRFSSTTLLVIALIVLFIPTYVMLFKACSITDGALLTAGVDSVAVGLQNGTVISSPADDEGQLLNSLLQMHESAKAASLPTDLGNYTSYKASFTVYGSEAEYEYYFCEDPSQCYFKSNHDKTFRISSDLAVAFLTQSFAEPVYKSAAAPTLSISGQKMEAQSLGWSYRDCTGAYLDSAASFSETYKVNDLADISMNLHCEFSRSPDRLQVTVQSVTGEEIYSGDIAGMAGVVLEKNVEVLMTLNAEWDKNGGAACGGSAVYKLKGLLHAPAEFYLNTSSIYEGGFVVVSGSNVLDMSGLSIKVEPQDSLSTPYTYQPKFYQDGEYVRALIPVSKDLGNGTCGYRVVVTVGETAYTMTFTAKKAEPDPSSKTVGLNVSVPDGVKLQADPYGDLYEVCAADIAKYTAGSKVNMTGAFGIGVSGYDGIRSNYGTILTYSTLKEVLVSHDSSYVGGGATELKAMHSGKIVYVGSTAYTAGLVIIDHGMGLYSWYWNLRPDTIGAEIVPGAEIETGATIGKIKGGGVSEVYNGIPISAHVGLTVMGTPVDAVQLRETGVQFGDGESYRVIATVSGVVTPGTSDAASSGSADSGSAQSSDAVSE